MPFLCNLDAWPRERLGTCHAIFSFASNASAGGRLQLVRQKVDTYLYAKRSQFGMCISANSSLPIEV